MYISFNRVFLSV